MSKSARLPAGSLVAMPTLVILLTGQAMATMDASILAVASPSLRADLNASGAELQLVLAVYTLAFAALVVTGARLGDALGRRRAFLAGLAAFTLASLAGGLAPNPATLVAARGVQGCAAALMTPQVLSIIQLQFDGETRARAIGAYSMILAVGVAAGQVLGGLLVGAHLLTDAWRPALLLNVPIGAVLLAMARRRLVDPRAAGGEQLDLAGVAVLSAALVALVVPLTFGRQAGWPAWVWACLAASGAGLAGFVAVERRVRAHDGHPLLDLELFRIPGVAAGVTSVLLAMSCYAGFLLSLTLHLQDGLGFSPLHAGLIFAVYASGFAGASLTWTRAGTAVRRRLPLVGPLAMGGALLGVGAVAAGGGWPTAVAAPLMFLGGVGHACGFSPIASRLTASVRPQQVADVSGLVLTASLIGNVMGAAGFVGVYLSAAPKGSAHALVLTTRVLAGVLVLTAGLALRTIAPTTRRGDAKWLPSTRRS
jgi:predicted MFS family arabinose efflux permease